MPNPRMHAIPCSDWRSDYQKRWRSNNRAKVVSYTQKQVAKRRLVINKFKDVPCTDCGIRYAWYVMQFDHRDPITKLFYIGRAIVSRKLEDLVGEVAKCDVVCANCHAIRTYKRCHEER